MTVDFDTNHTGQRLLGRRRLLSGIAAAGALALAGCSSDDGDGNGGGNGNGGSGGNGGGGGNGASADGTIGQVVSNDLASLMVEYVRPVETVVDYLDLPRTDEAPYGIEQTVADYVETGLVQAGNSFYGVGVAVKNRSNRMLDASTVLLQQNDGAGLGFMILSGRSMRYGFEGGGRNNRRTMAPGELMRAEIVFALPEDPSGYTLVFEPYQEGAIAGINTLTVDLSSGSEGTAGFGQEVSPATVGQSAAVGDFDVTMTDVSLVDSVAESPFQELFGPRDGFRYLRLTLSATRTAAEMTGQWWAVGVVDPDGYAFSWRSAVYQNALTLARDSLEDLAVGESLEDFVLAFPVEPEFDVRYATMAAYGPIEDPPAMGEGIGFNRVFWPVE